MYISELVIKIRQNLIFICGLVLAVFIGFSSTAPNIYGSPYFTGSGGMGMKLGILVPEGKGLNENQAYLPVMVQGCLVSNVSKYSAITVLDRVSLDKVIAETLDPTYEDNFDIVSLGHVAHVEYMMTGSITRTSSGYALQLNVTKTTPDAPTIASYSGTCTVAQFDDFSAIHRASKELLTQMGVQLTTAAANELDKASPTQDISAQTALAQGITAQQKGTVVEAMAYYYNAVSFDPKLSEASGRLSTLSSTITSGNIGENVRNDIERRKQWIAILEECNLFFKNHLPYEIVYNPKLTQESVDYQKETVNISFPMFIQPKEDDFKIIQDILTGLEKTGKLREWDLQAWPLTSDTFVDALIDRGEGMDDYGVVKFRGGNRGNSYRGGNRDYGKSFDVYVALINSDGKTISEANKTFFQSIKIGRENKLESNYTEGLGGEMYTRVMNRLKRPTVFQGVPANNITDKLTIKVISVNGIDISKNPDYIRVSAQSMPIQSIPIQPIPAPTNSRRITGDEFWFPNR